jgi:hypothetical protein
VISWLQPLLACDILVATFAFKRNVYCYTEANKARTAFQVYDLDEDGFVNVADLRSTLDSMLGRAAMTSRPNRPLTHPLYTSLTQLFLFLFPFILPPPMTDRSNRVNTCTSLRRPLGPPPPPPLNVESLVSLAPGNALSAQQVEQIVARVSHVQVPHGGGGGGY